MILNLILFFGYTVARTCKLDFLAAYGLDGEQTPQVRHMQLCSSVQFSCCTIFDELKFHKKWYDYYEPKMQLNHEKAVGYYKRLSEPVKYFKNFDWTDRESLVKSKKLGRAKEIIFKLQKIQLDEQLRPLLNDLPKLLEFEKKVKKGFLCLLCDYSNHEYLNAKQTNLLVQGHFCQRVVNNYGPFLQKRAKLLNPVLMLAYKAMSYFDTPHYQKRHTLVIKNVIRHKKAVEKCFDKENAAYDFEKCKKLCNKYSVSSLSPVFYGEFDFYIQFLDRFKKFRRWLDNLKPKKSKDEEAEEDKEKDKKKDKEGEKEGEKKEDKEGDKEGDKEQEEDEDKDEDPEKEESKKGKDSGRILEARNTKLKKKINKISRSLNDYKKIIKNLRRYNNNYLKKIYRNSRKLERKKRLLRNTGNYMDYGNIYALYNRNLQGDAQTNPSMNANQGAQPQANQQNSGTQINNAQPNQQNMQTNQQTNAQTQQMSPEANNPPPQVNNQGQVQQPTNQGGASGQLSPTQTSNNDQNPSNRNSQPGSQNLGKNEAPETPSEQKVEDSANDPKLGNINCLESKDAFKCIESTNVRNSTSVVNSTNITNSENVTLSDQVSKGFDIFNVTNGTSLFNVTNSTNVADIVKGTELKNVTKCEDCTNVQNSTNCTNCHNCTNVHNCTNCQNANNVTDGFNIRNVTDSRNVQSVINGTRLDNVTDSTNVTMLVNATNMTNARNCNYCKHNYDCEGKKCMIPRIEGGELKQKIKEIIYKHSEKIIDRLYALFRPGKLKAYKEDPNAFDPQIYRASSFYNDLERFRYMFDNEGVLLENDIGPSFVEEPTKIKEAALTELLKEKSSDDLAISTNRKSDELRNKLDELANFKLVYGFITDINRGVMSYDYIRGRMDTDIQFEEEEDKRFEEHIEGDKDSELEPAELEARKLMHVLKNHRKIKKTIN